MDCQLPQPLVPQRLGDVRTFADYRGQRQFPFAVADPRSSIIGFRVLQARSQIGGVRNSFYEWSRDQAWRRLGLSIRKVWKCVSAHDKIPGFLLQPEHARLRS